MQGDLPLHWTAFVSPAVSAVGPARHRQRTSSNEVRKSPMGSVTKWRRKRMSKKKHRKMLRRTRVQRRKLGK